MQNARRSSGGFAWLATAICLAAAAGGNGATGPATAAAEPEARPGAAKANIAPNVVTIANKSGAAQNNYPVQIARPFMPGEIAHFPRVVIEGTPVPTQADVKMRYADGSVKHAVISFLVPTLPANGDVKVAFADQAEGNNAPLTKEQMLDAAYDFDAVMELTGADATKSASARAMLEKGSFTYWTRGPIATTVILADHSAEGAYDLGFDNSKPFRPIFHATFWPGIKKVRVRFIGELANSKAIEDLTVKNLVLKTGKANPAAAYILPAAKSPFTMFGASRWTKTFWVGGEPSNKVNIDHNLAYLKETRFFPNYDVSLKVPEATIAGQYGGWQKASPDLYDAGYWQKYMPNVGGRQDIGHTPAWTARWLYTGDYRMREVAFGHAELATAWGLHVRESDPKKFLDKKKAVPALGHPTNYSARPTLWMFDGRAKAKPEDAIDPVGPKTNGGWIIDGAHQPDPFSSQYVLSGDYFYLEELQFWVSYFTLAYNPTPTVSYGRGPGDAAGIEDQIRGEAWAFRNRVAAAFASPDDDPEKAVFAQAVDDAIAIWEGRRLIKGTAFQDNPAWAWGAKYAMEQSSPAFRWWKPGGTHPAAIGEGKAMDKAKCSTLESQWQNYMVMMELGIAKEKGFATGALLSWLAPMLIKQCTEPGHDRHLLVTYYAPVTDQNRKEFPSWAASMAAYAEYNPANAKDSFEHNAQDPEHGYCTIATAAASFITGEPGGKETFDWLKSAVRDAHLAIHSANPKWAMLPRETPAVPESAAAASSKAKG
jgi:hypothetical protein